MVQKFIKKKKKQRDVETESKRNITEKDKVSLQTGLKEFPSI